MSCRKPAKLSETAAMFCADGFCRFVLAAFPASAAQHLSCLTGQTASACEKWLRGETRPSADAFAAMIGAFGPQFLSAVLAPPPAWAADAARRQRRAALEHELAAMDAGQPTQ